MYEEKIVWKNAGIDDFTDAEIEAVGKFIWDNNKLIDMFTYDIYDDIMTECTNGLRSMGYKFECDNIGFDDGYADGYVENIKYMGDALNDDFYSYDEKVYIIPTLEFEENGRVARGWSYYPNGDEIGNAVRYEIQIENDDGDTIINEYGLTFSDIEDMHNKGMIDDDNWVDVVEWHDKIVGTLESEYNPFVEDIHQLEKVYEDVLTLRSREFFDEILMSMDVAFAFMPDGRVIDYEVNSSK